MWVRFLSEPAGMLSNPGSLLYRLFIFLPRQRASPVKPHSPGISASGLGEEHVFGYLSPSVLCLFFLDGHRIHVVGSNKQGLVSEFRADLCQEFLRARNLQIAAQ